MLRAVALRFMLQHWKQHFTSSNSACTLEFHQKKEKQSTCVAVAWCGRCIAADIAIAIAILCCLPAVATMCNCISHRAMLHITPLHWWLHCTLCHGIFMPCKGMPWRCSWGRGDVFCSAALHVVPRHGSLCCSLALHAAAFSCHSVMLCATAFCRC